MAVPSWVSAAGTPLSKHTPIAMTTQQLQARLAGLESTVHSLALTSARAETVESSSIMKKRRSSSHNEASTPTSCDSLVNAWRGSYVDLKASVEQTIRTELHQIRELIEAIRNVPSSTGSQDAGTGDFGSGLQCTSKMTNDAIVGSFDSTLFSQMKESVEQNVSKAVGPVLATVTRFEDKFSALQTSLQELHDLNTRSTQRHIPEDRSRQRHMQDRCRQQYRSESRSSEDEVLNSEKMFEKEQQVVEEILNSTDVLSSLKADTSVYPVVNLVKPPGWVQRIKMCWKPFGPFVQKMREQQDRKRHGPLASIVDSNYFEVFCAIVIAIHTYKMGRDINARAKDPFAPEVGFPWGELIFAGYYGFELLLRMSVHGCSFLICSNWKWNWFDLLVFLLSVGDLISEIVLNETKRSVRWMRTLRMAKLGKFLRTFRVMRCITELRTILNSLLGSLISLFWSICMLIIFLYLFGILFAQTVSGYRSFHGKDIGFETEQAFVMYFGCIQCSMLTLYKSVTGGADWGPIYHVLEETGSHTAALFLFFTAFISIALLNIITGLFVDCAMKSASPSLAVLAMKDQQEGMMVRTELGDMLNRFAGVDDRGIIGPSELQTALLHPEFHSFLGMYLGLHISDPVGFLEFVKENRGDSLESVSANDFITACVKMKGVASNLDMQIVAFNTKRLSQLQRKSAIFEKVVVDKLDDIASKLH
eukprot:TRINITY_DN7349_c0_g1_i4.p1 TRINITY_DN7349_c0_g1~~TRINITY_DN7349_c0_g1_i4.p1  ORF type:complete len:704 (+),score=112.10 TRINITY_DN7349_c0_g1_i4:59-2170(+)